MNRSMPGLPVHHHLPEFTQTHVHRVCDAIQPSHPGLSPSPPAPNPSQHQSFPMSQLFTSGGQSTGVSALASVLPKNTQDWFPLGWTGWIFLQSKGLSRVFSNTTVQKHQFFGRSAFFTVQLSHPYMTTGKTIALTRRAFLVRSKKKVEGQEREPNQQVCSLSQRSVNNWVWSLRIFLSNRTQGCSSLQSVCGRAGGRQRSYYELWEVQSWTE